MLLHTWSATGNCAANNDCPLWSVPGDNGSCECGSDLDGIVKCNNESRETYLLGCFCMSYDSTGLVVGACPYHCYRTDRVALHYPLPKHIIDLEDFLCGPLNRKGRMCGQCKDNFTTSAYSYDLRCVKCSGGHYNWAKYVAVALLPPTAFFILVVTFRISVTLPPMVVLVHFLQISKYVSPRDSLENAIWFVLVETKTWPDISLGKICTEPVERGVYPDMSGTSYTLCKTAKCFSAESI